MRGSVFPICVGWGLEALGPRRRHLFGGVSRASHRRSAIARAPDPEVASPVAAATPLARGGAHMRDLAWTMSGGPGSPKRERRAARRSVFQERRVPHTGNAFPPGVLGARVAALPAQLLGRGEPLARDYAVCSCL